MCVKTSRDHVFCNICYDFVLLFTIILCPSHRPPTQPPASLSAQSGLRLPLLDKRQEIRLAWNILAQDLRNDEALWSLVVLENAAQSSLRRAQRAVERVYVFLPCGGQFLVSEPDLELACLVVCAVGDGDELLILSTAGDGEPGLEVALHGCRVVWMMSTHGRSRQSPTYSVLLTRWR
jgi:hypothetical protein